MAFNLLRRLVRHLDRVEQNTDIALIVHLTEFSKCFRSRWDDNLAIPLIVVLNGGYNGRLDSRTHRSLQPGDQPSPGRQRYTFRIRLEYHSVNAARSLSGHPRSGPSSAKNIRGLGQLLDLRSWNGCRVLWLLWRKLNSVQSVVFGLRPRGWRRWCRGIPERGACLR